jgi:hypothetical protein
MTIETDLEELAREAAAYQHAAENAPDDAVREKFHCKRHVVMIDASGLLARSPEALKLKASMLREDDYMDREPAAGAAYLLRSLLRDLTQWEPKT